MLRLVGRGGGEVDRFEFFLQINKQDISIGQEYCYISIYFFGF